MMNVIVKVFDKRCTDGINYRQKIVKNKKDAINFVNSVKNKASLHYTIIANGVAESFRY